MQSVDRFQDKKLKLNLYSLVLTPIAHKMLGAMMILWQYYLLLFIFWL